MNMFDQFRFQKKEKLKLSESYETRANEHCTDNDVQQNAQGNFEAQENHRTLGPLAGTLFGLASIVDVKPQVTETKKESGKRKQPTKVQNPKKSRRIKKDSLQVKVIKTGIMHGVRKEKNGEESKVPTYQTNSEHKRGHVLLINNIIFSNRKNRSGADVDHDNIIKLFGGMGFIVEDYKNLSEKEMMKVIKTYRENPSLATADINITVIMSHGGADHQTYISDVNGKHIYIDKIVNLFGNNNCQHLTNKPKIFIFQSCRGNLKETLETDDDQKLEKVRTRSYSDIFIAYATVKAYVAYRHPLRGSIYIEAICKVFMEHAHDTYLEDLLKMVDYEVATYKARGVQTTCYESKAFKKCFFNPIDIKLENSVQ